MTHEKHDNENETKGENGFSLEKFLWLFQLQWVNVANVIDAYLIASRASFTTLDHHRFSHTRCKSTRTELKTHIYPPPCLSIKMRASQGANDFRSHFRFYLISGHANIIPAEEKLNISSAYLTAKLISLLSNFCDSSLNKDSEINLGGIMKGIIRQRRSNQSDRTAINSVMRQACQSTVGQRHEYRIGNSLGILEIT